MSDFKYSIVLFSGVDGLPLEFNIVHATEKVELKAMIELGGGLCTLSEDAIHLVSKGSKVLNVEADKKCLSVQYIFDCVSENYLLDEANYRIKITEVETSDISEDSENIIKPSNEKEPEAISKKSVDKDNLVEMDTSDELLNENSRHNVMCSNVLSEDFEPAKLGQISSTPSFPDTECTPEKITGQPLLSKIMKLPSEEKLIEEYVDLSRSDVIECSESDNVAHNKLLTSSQSDVSIEDLSSERTIEEYSRINKSDVSHEHLLIKYNNVIIGPPEMHQEPVNIAEDISLKTASDLQLKTNDSCSVDLKTLAEITDVETGYIRKGTKCMSVVMDEKEASNYATNVDVNKVLDDFPIAAVSSSQPEKDVLDDFDYLVLEKAKRKHLEEDEEPLFQSYTVSSSGDAQVENKADVSGDIFEESPVAKESPAAPDSGNLNTQSFDRQLYISRLEAEVEEILRKPSPKSLQDKICLVKYICCVKRLPPAEALQFLQNLGISV